MAIDPNKTYPLVDAQLALVAALSAAFGDGTFNARDASDVLGCHKASVAARLANLVHKGAAFRVETGVFSMVKPARLFDEEDARTAREEIGDIEIVDRPITDPEQAFNWLRSRKVDVARFGDLFLLSGRIRLTAEQLVASAERRRTVQTHQRNPRSMLIDRLPTQIPEPKDAQRMRGR